MNIVNPLKNLLKSHLASSRAMLAVNVQSIQQIEIVSVLSSELQTEVIIQFSAKYIDYFEKLIGNHIKPPSFNMLWANPVCSLQAALI